MDKETLAELISSINYLADEISNLSSTQGFSGHTIAESLEIIALEMINERERKEKQNK